jgi:hypothetical protein
MSKWYKVFNWATMIISFIMCGLLFWFTQQIIWYKVLPFVLFIWIFSFLNGYIRGIYLDAKLSIDEIKRVRGRYAETKTKEE